MKSDFDAVKEFVERFGKHFKYEVSMTDPEGREGFPYIMVDVDSDDNPNRKIHLFFDFIEDDLVSVGATVDEEE